ncbi:MAG TPA: hypothetical protein VGE43_11155, partial [Acidimicrobiales bacterium]
PIGTWADLGMAVLETLDRQDLEDLVDGIEEFFGGFDGTVGGGFVPSDMDDLDKGFGFDEELDFEEGSGSPDGFGTETSTEAFDDLGEPIPGDGSEPGTAPAVDPTTEELLAELLLTVTGDQAVADCALGELYANATTDQLYELADAYQYDFEPSVEAQDVLFGAVERCGG